MNQCLLGLLHWQAGSLPLVPSGKPIIPGNGGKKLYGSFIIGLECKSRTSRDTWSNRQIWLWSTKEADQGLTEFCQDDALVIVNTLFQQHKRRLNTWTSPDGQYRNQTDYILCSQRWRSYIVSKKMRLEADCGSDYELLIAKFRLKLKKVGKPTI